MKTTENDENHWKNEKLEGLKTYEKIKQKTGKDKRKETRKTTKILRTCNLIKQKKKK